MLRACLIIAIAAGLGTICLTLMKVSPKISGLESQVSSLSTQLTSAENEARDAKAQMEEAVSTAEQLKGTLATTQEDLETATARAIEQRRRADELDRALAASEARFVEADRALNRYVATGVTVEEIRELDKKLREMTEERDVFVAENAVMARKVRDLEAELLHYFGPPSYEVELPEGLSGSVVAVDDQWDFVVLDIGKEDGVVEHGRLMISRDGQLVAKVQVSSVMENRSIANVLPEWKQAKVEAGDNALY